MRKKTAKHPLLQKILKRTGIVLGGLAAFLLCLWGVWWLSWVEERQELAVMLKEPMASKELLGMTLRSSNEEHRVPAERAFLNKGHGPEINRYFEMPQGETTESLLVRLKDEARGGGWVLDERGYTLGNHYFSAHKKNLRMNIGVNPSSSYSPVYISISK